MVKGNYSVIILGDNSNTALSVIRALSKTKFPLYGIDVTKKRNFSFWSRYLTGYFLVNSNKIDSLLHIIENINKKKSIILPVTEKAALLVDRVKNILGENYIILCSKSISYYELINKQRMVDLARRAGFNVPKSVIGVDIANIKRLKFPIIIKTINNLKGKRYHILKNINELYSINFSQYERLDELIAQEHIFGEEYVVSACRLQNGEVIIGSICKKIKTWPQGKGESTVISSYWVDGLHGKISELLNLSDWYGMVDLDLILDVVLNKIYFIEINYRPGAGFIIGVLGGINLPEILVHNALNLPYNQPVEKIPDGLCLIQDALFLNHFKTIKKNKIIEYYNLLKKADGYTIFNSVDFIPFIIFWTEKFSSLIFKVLNPFSYIKKIRKMISNYLYKNNKENIMDNKN